MAPAMGSPTPTPNKAPEGRKNPHRPAVSRTPSIRPDQTATIPQRVILNAVKDLPPTCDRYTYTPQLFPLLNMWFSGALLPTPHRFLCRRNRKWRQRTPTPMQIAWEGECPHSPQKLRALVIDNQRRIIADSVPAHSPGGGVIR